MQQRPDREYNDEYATSAASAAALRVYVPGVSTNAIADWLGFETAMDAPPEFFSGTGVPWGHPDYGYQLSSEEAIASRDPRRHLDYVLDAAAAAQDAIADLRQLEGSLFQVRSLFVSERGDGGPMFRQDQLAVVSELGLELAVEAAWKDLPDAGEPARQARPSGAWEHPTPRDGRYPTCEEARITFSVHAGDIQPEEVSTRLGIQASTTRVKGNDITSVPGRNAVVKRHYWELSSADHVASLDLRDHVDWLTARLLPRMDELAALRQRTGFDKDVVNGSWWSKAGSGGPALWPSQLSALAYIGAELRLELAYYGDG